MVVPIKLIPINLHSMRVLMLLHLNPAAYFCYLVWLHQQWIFLQKGLKMHSIKRIYPMEMLVCKALPVVSKCGCWIASCLTRSEESLSYSLVSICGCPITFMDSSFISPGHFPPFPMFTKFPSQNRSLQLLYAHKEKLQLSQCFSTQPCCIKPILNVL